MILLVYHVTSTSNTSFFFFFVFYIALSVSTNRSLLICTRFPFHNKYSALGFSLTNLRSFPPPIRKYAAASSIDNVYFSIVFHNYSSAHLLSHHCFFYVSSSDIGGRQVALYALPLPMPFLPCNCLGILFQ